MKTILNKFKYLVFAFVILMQPITINSSSAFDTVTATSVASILPACSSYYASGTQVVDTSLMDAAGVDQCTTASNGTNVRIYKVWFCSAANPPVTPLLSASRAADLTGCFQFFDGNFYPTISADGSTSGTPTGTINTVPPGKYKYVVMELDHVTRFRAAIAVKTTTVGFEIVGSKDDPAGNTTYIANDTTAYCYTVGGSYVNDLTGTTTKDTLTYLGGTYFNSSSTSRANTSCSTSATTDYNNGGGISAVTFNCYNRSYDYARENSASADRVCEEWDGGVTAVYGNDTLNYYLYKPFEGNVVCGAVGCSGVRRHLAVQTLATEIGDNNKSPVGFDVGWNVTQGAIMDTGNTCDVNPCALITAKRISFRQGPFFMQMKFLFE